MIYLLLSILSSALIYVIFRISKNYEVGLNLLITLNYLVAMLLGFSVLLRFNLAAITEQSSWMPSGTILGILFILMFFLLGTSSQKAGISVTTLANKLSLVFPVLFSLVYFNEEITLLKYAGLVLAFTAVLLTIYKKDVRKTRLVYILLPLAIFFGSGLIDSLIKYIQATQISVEQDSAFTTFVFIVAFICGSLFSIVKRKPGKLSIHRPTIFLGSLLGVANFGSLYFFINALNKSGMESSLVFAINNMSIVVLSAILGVFLFREKLNKFNFAGIALAVLSLYILLK